MTPFDPIAYWRERLARHPSLRGTGTSFAPEAWQRWFYRAKRRAYHPLLARHGVRLARGSVVDLGCGTGFFEDEWQRAGAAALVGIDVVPEVIERLRAQHPERLYMCVDLADHPDALRALPPQDLVTAIDVLYHIIDDDRLLATLRALVGTLRPGGHLLFTDALRDARPGPHVRFRPIERWRAMAAELGLELLERTPVAVALNRPTRLARVAPRIAGAASFFADLALLRLVPALANNWVLLARKGQSSES
jgi:SAM-dependent methyltransferase